VTNREDLGAGPEQASFRYEDVEGCLRDVLETAHSILPELRLQDNPERRADGQERVVKTAVLADAQVARIDASLGRYERTIEIAEAFLRRRATELADEFLEMTRLFSTYLRFQRVAVDVTEETWKQMFVRESVHVLASIVTLVQGARDCFV
jgi:hypothetical protein